jgi:nanoRNase/pAp phosphatase (c-di-AMP/oligoRNAs hydrolase)
MARRSPLAARPGRSISSAVRRSDRFLAGLADAQRVVFVSHVHPDPDSLGSMFGLAHLIESKLGKSVVLTQDGPISRAENRAMVETLHLELKPIEKHRWKPHDAIVMVDSQPNTGRHSFDSTRPLYAVIDHHDTPGDLANVRFTDVRPNHGATCTLVTKYLLEQRVPLTEKVATALFYGIETEVAGFPREASPADDEALNALYPHADKDLLAQIRNARLPHSHFECLLQALQSSFIYDRLIISWVDPLPQPEQAAEVVDFMIRFDKVDWALCGGVHEGKMILSLRSAFANAGSGELLRAVVGRMGPAVTTAGPAGPFTSRATPTRPSRRFKPACGGGCSKPWTFRKAAGSGSSRCGKCCKICNNRLLERLDNPGKACRL